MSHWAGCPGTDVRTDRDGTYCGLCGTRTHTRSGILTGDIKSAPATVCAAPERDQNQWRFQ